MSSKRAGFGAVVAGILGGLALTGTLMGAAYALDASQDARVQQGQHQFYVWCTGADDFSMTGEGATAEAAQMAIYEKLKAEGRTSCWPIWQGKVS